MSQMMTRKSAAGDDKSSRQSDSPVKDMKKKVAANAEKEKQAADKPVDKKDKPAEKAPEKKDKAAEKVTEKKDKVTEKVTEKKDKVAEKVTEKKDKVTEKVTEKKDKVAEKVTEKKDKPAEKVTEKKDKGADKSVDKVSEKKDDADKKEQDKGEKSGKTDNPEPAKHPETPKQNGQSINGTATNGQDSTVSSDEEDILVIEEQDEVFPELTYDDDDDGFEPPTPENLHSRSYTRRSQVKPTRTPETPRPASDKQTHDTDQGTPGSPSVLAVVTENENQVKEIARDDSKDPKEKDSKVLKLNDVPSDRKLRSSDVSEGEKKSADDSDVIVLEDEDGESRKPDTNYSKSRVKVSPYRRSMRLDQTNTSLQANYTGNNTTMEMDITESSLSDPPLEQSPYLSGLRTIRGRRSYKLLKELNLRKLDSGIASNVTLSEQGRPTVTVVGRKRKPETDLDITEMVSRRITTTSNSGGSGSGGKRARLIDRIPLPFRRAREMTAPEIVGINTDLPLTTPAQSLDPETLKPAPIATPLVATQDRKCIVM